MFIVRADKVISSVTQTEKMTSGSQNVYVVQFEFSDEWQYLERTAVFRRGDTIINILLDDDNHCMVPWEVMTTKGANVDVGVFGVRDGDVVMPTTWASMGSMLEGVITGKDLTPPTPDVYQQILARLKKVEDALGVGGGTGGVNFTVDQTLTLDENDILSVTKPVQRVVTQAEYDLLPEVDKMTGFWVIR